MIQLAAQEPIEETPVAILVIGIMEDGHARTVAVGLGPEHKPLLRSVCREIRRQVEGRAA